MPFKPTASERRSIFLLLFLIPFLMGMGVDSFVPSLPAINMYFKTSAHVTQLTIGLYMLGYALGQITWGVLSDSWGRRKLLLTTGGCFFLTSLVTGFSPNIEALILCRFLQGLFIAGPAVLIRAIASDCFSDLALTRAMSFIATSWALGPILGPLIGSYLQHYLNWQANFYFLALYAAGTFGYAALTLKETHHQRTPFYLPTLQAMLKEISTHPLFLIYVTICALLYSSLVIFNVIAPFLIQINLHYSVIDYGRIALVLGFGYFLGNLVNRFLLRSIHPMKLTLIGILGTTLTAFVMLILSLLLQPQLWVIVVPSLVLFFFSGFAFPNMMGASAALFPKMGGTASAVFGSFVITGVFIFSCLATLLSTHSETPLALLYVAMFISTLILFVSKSYFKP